MATKTTTVSVNRTSDGQISVTQPVGGATPIKFTWKSLLGLLGAILGALTASIPQMHLPPAVSSALIAGGAVIIALERVADSIDYHAILSGQAPTIDQTSLNQNVESLISKVEALEAAVKNPTT